MDAISSFLDLASAPVDLSPFFLLLCSDESEWRIGLARYELRASIAGATPIQLFDWSLCVVSGMLVEANSELPVGDA